MHQPCPEEQMDVEDELEVQLYLMMNGCKYKWNYATYCAKAKRKVVLNLIPSSSYKLCSHIVALAEQQKLLEELIGIFGKSKVEPFSCYDWYA